MMKEGVKALTDILVSQLQNDIDWKDQKPMKFVFKNKDGELRPMLTEFRNNGECKKGSIDELNTSEGNVSNLASEHDGNNVKGIERVIDESGSEVQFFSGDDYNEEDLDDPEFHLKDPNSEVLFDYSLDNLQDLENEPSAAIGKHVMEMIESLLPKGAPYRDKVISTMKDNLQTQDDQTTMNQDSTKMLSTGHETNSELTCNGNLECETVDTSNLYEDDDVHPREAGTDKACNPHLESSEHNLQSIHESNQHTGGHAHGCTRQQHEEYMYECKPKLQPDFYALTTFDTEEQPLCLFCEYYLVFGKPPRQMIKWYNKYGSAAALAPSSNPQQNDKSSRNTNKKKKTKKGKR